MSALHFGAYYKLLLNEPADKPLPELWRARDASKGRRLASIQRLLPARNVHPSVARTTHTFTVA